MTDTTNRVLSLPEVLALPDGEWVYIEINPDAGVLRDMFSGVYTLRNGMLRDNVCDVFTPGGPGHLAGNFRVWALPQPPTPQESEANPWRKEGEASEWARLG